MNRLSEDQIVRMPAIEKKYGIDDLKLYAYQDDRDFKVVGEIVSDMISDSFKFTCTIYDEDGDMIESEENVSYGDGLVTSTIKPKVFFNGYPFIISSWLKEGVRVGKIRIIPS